MNAGKLYLVSTPIGNLGDISPRGLETLRSVSLIAAEDTRVTLKLLTHFGIKKPMISYNKNNMTERAAEIISKLELGGDVAVVTDAGTPAVSDPGEDIVRLCHENGYTIIPIPGACAAIAALSASGLFTGRVFFLGLRAVTKKSPRAHSAELKDETRTMIFYEAPHKLPATLADLHRIMGDRRITLARELTKIHEEIRCTSLGEAAEYYITNKPRGEFVLIVEGRKKEKAPPPDPKDTVHTAMDAGASVRDAAKLAASRGMSRNEAYKEALKKK